MRYLIITLGILFAACQQEKCNCINPIFTEYQPYDDVYKIELARAISLCNKGNVHTWIEAYEEKEGREYMHVKMAGSTICAIAVMDVTGNEELRQYRSTNRKPEVGVRLPHIKYHVVKTNTSYDVVLDEIGAFID